MMFLELEIISYWLMVNGLLESGKCCEKKQSRVKGDPKGGAGRIWACCSLT